VLLQYTTIVSPQHYPVESRLVIFAAFTVSLGHLLLEIALPVIVPLVVTWGAFRLAVHLLLRD
jgi:hypothetical protein